MAPNISTFKPTSSQDRPAARTACGGGKALRPSQHTHSDSGRCRLNNQRQSNWVSTAAASTGPVTVLSATTMEFSAMPWPSRPRG